MSDSLKIVNENKSRYIDLIRYISDSNYDGIPKNVESNILNKFSYFFTDAETTYSLRTILIDCLIESNIEFVMLDEFKFRCSSNLYYGVMGFDICIYTSTEEQKIIKDRNGQYIVDFGKRYGDNLAFCDIYIFIKNKILDKIRPVHGKSMFDKSLPVITSDEFHPDYILKSITPILYFLKSVNDRIHSLNIPDTPRKFSEFVSYEYINKKNSESLDIPKLIL